jgi:hypothetical protein
VQNIKLGDNYFGKEITYREDGSYGVIAIVARPRYGKTILVKNMLSQIAENRRTIVFDYQGEWSDIKYGNWQSKDKICFVPDLYTVENFGFYLSDFNQINDWISMGFSKNSASMIVNFLQYDNIHHNNPIHFLEFLQDLPTTDNDLPAFNEHYSEYGLRLKSRVHDSTKQSILANMDIITSTGLIIPPVGSKEYNELYSGKIYVEDWAQLVMEYPHISINLNIKTSDSVGLARASVGKILEKILPVMVYTKPFILFEEADYLCPFDGDNITSMLMIRSYVLKHQRTGVKVGLITQEPSTMDQFTLMGATSWIMGIHMKSTASASALNQPNFDYHRDVISKLNFDKNTNIREFAYMEAGNGGRYEIFRTIDSYTRDPLRR